jgi:hypothetical protein
VEKQELRKDYIGYSLIHRTAILVKKFPWFETILIIVVMSISLYAALSDPQNMSWQWFTRDDAYYYFKVAQNISEGHGSTFDGINRTNGYHPLWMLICIPIFALARFDLILTPSASSHEWVVCRDGYFALPISWPHFYASHWSDGRLVLGL